MKQRFIGLFSELVSKQNRFEDKFQNRFEDPFNFLPRMSFRIYRLEFEFDQFTGWMVGHISFKTRLCQFSRSWNEDNLWNIHFLPPIFLEERTPYHWLAVVAVSAHLTASAFVPLTTVVTCWLSITVKYTSWWKLIGWEGTSRTWARRTILGSTIGCVTIETIGTLLAVVACHGKVRSCFVTIYFTGSWRQNSKEWHSKTLPVVLCWQSMHTPLSGWQ